MRWRSIRLAINFMKKTKHFCRLALGALFVGSLVFPWESRAASVLFDSTLFRVQSSAGTRLDNSSDFGAALGYFTGSFVPTASNYAQWFDNFVGVVGYHKDAGGGLNTVSAAITVITVAGPANEPDFSVFDYAATVASSQGGPLVTPSTTVGMSLAEGRQFSLIIWNAAKAASLGSATEAGIFTNTTWVINTQFDVASPELVDLNLSPSGMSSTLGLVSTTAGERYFQLAVIPEPSSMSLVIMGLASALAFRRKRASLRGGR